MQCQQMCFYRAQQILPREGRRTGSIRTQKRHTTKEREKTSRAIPSLSLSYSLSRTCSLATLVTPTTSTLVQDNTRLIPPLVFHLAPTHLGRDTQ
jgi:hypothetical protein